MLYDAASFYGRYVFTAATMNMTVVTSSHKQTKAQWEMTNLISSQNQTRRQQKDVGDVSIMKMSVPCTGSIEVTANLSDKNITFPVASSQ